MDINQKQSEDKHLDISTSQQTKACETKPVFSWLSGSESRL